ncbi:hypothetical protein CDD80_3462 [Ophiocordyceps camponoti-rufipedis]|uniref:Uncharacterized protein n=1 Tax=Ophiocordyceps camponoti-rufipedis TaxID=2004952 RepID=A0A2C5Y795_9HYPO|nr:hypothetical protein CDD80_3462 [Ophiocordyceps camponoti-rufipedis]
MPFALQNAVCWLCLSAGNRDHLFRNLVYDELKKKPPRLECAGYRRLIQVYGSEPKFFAAVEDGIDDDGDESGTESEASTVIATPRRIGKLTTPIPNRLLLIREAMSTANKGRSGRPALSESLRALSGNVYEYPGETQEAANEYGAACLLRVTIRCTPSGHGSGS